MDDSIPPEPPVEAPTALVCGLTGNSARSPPPLPTSQPVVVDKPIVAEKPNGSHHHEGSVTTTVSTAATVEQSPSPIPSDPSLTGPIASSSMEDVMKEFIDYEQTLSMPDYIKRFYQIRLEQEALRNDDEYSSISACDPIHFARNRYRDILPYDENRVKLSSSEENPDGYMNASHIQLPGGKARFIAAQAPLPATLDEWWQMVDEQKVSLILMLCKLVEMCKVKCERYWPSEKGAKEVFGNYEITFEDEQTFDDDEYLLRVLRMENQITGEVRTIQQLHYREWPDHGCPSGERQLLNMIDRIEGMHDAESPVLVHCSAGVGRTGTIIAVNYIRELMEAKTLNSLDLFELVMSLRKQRASMVQTQDQYQFVHKCVAHYCRKQLGLPEPEPVIAWPKPCTLNPVQSYCGGPPSAALEDSSDEELDGTVVPDFPHEPPAPRGPEELGSAAS